MTEFWFSRSFAGAITRVMLTWLLGVLFAIVAAVLVVALIESHRMPPAAQRPSPKPITVTIVPAR